ncbi:HNH endonuclease [Clostridium tyrobutyricum]|uniref:HNH endonuclease n=1 Tax=Clostridium tyrobutyricum TaxID=1519 RepID=UPI0030CE7883
MNNNIYVVGEIETTIILNNGEKFRISTESLNKVTPYTWCTEGNGYAMSRTFGKAVKLHRIITGASKAEIVDHIDGNVKNNTLYNLRICKKQQNEFNTKIRSDNTTGFKGVSYDKRRNKYRSYIVYYGKQISLGQYKYKLDAAKAYNRKALELFGKFARLNDLNQNIKEHKNNNLKIV